MHGTWEWETNADWRTILRPDGTGTRGFSAEPEIFMWVVETETRHIWKIRPDSRLESWDYGFDGDILVLTNWYREGGQQRRQSFGYFYVGGY